MTPGPKTNILVSSNLRTTQHHSYRTKWGRRYANDTTKDQAIPTIYKWKHSAWLAQDATRHGTKAMTKNTKHRTLVHYCIAWQQCIPARLKKEIQPLGAEVDKGLDNIINIKVASRSPGHVIITRLLTKTKTFLPLLTTPIQSRIILYFFL
jgi:hypothetical protein